MPGCSKNVNDLGDPGASAVETMFKRVREYFYRSFSTPRFCP